MFTGIIESTGTITDIRPEGSNLHIQVASNLSSSLKIDQSVAHDGVCLTVVQCDDQQHTVTAVAETLAKTNIASWAQGRLLNLERAMILGSRLDGHIVQGHVDTAALCSGREERNGSHVFHFEFPETFAPLVIEKGSVCINGVSLTAFSVGRQALSVTIIPYTLTHTGFQHLQPGDSVNIEFDILGKYLQRIQSLQTSE